MASTDAGRSEADADSGAGSEATSAAKAAQAQAVSTGDGSCCPSGAEAADAGDAIHQDVSYESLPEQAGAADSTGGLPEQAGGAEDGGGISVLPAAGEAGGAEDAGGIASEDTTNTKAKGDDAANEVGAPDSAEADNEMPPLTPGSASPVGKAASLAVNPEVTGSAGQAGGASPPAASGASSTGGTPAPVKQAGTGRRPKGGASGSSAGVRVGQRAASASGLRVCPLQLPLRRLSVQRPDRPRRRWLLVLLL